MAVSTKIIKGRIRSIGNTKKITKAMEMVDGAKMRKAVAAVLASRAYADLAWSMIFNLTAGVNEIANPLLQPRAEVKNILYVLFSSNRGLCGGYNSRVVAEAFQQSQRFNGYGATAHWLAVGKKAADAIVRSGRTLEAQFEKPERVATSADVMALSHLIINGFSDGTYDKVMIIYTDFVTPLVQQAKVKQLLPLEKNSDDTLGAAEEVFTDQPKPIQTRVKSAAIEYMFEPDPEIVLDQLLPRFIEVQLYQAMLESAASEHSARMIAMRNATDAAADMIDSLTLLFNQARQASITREIAEISGGKAALE
ncbi:MAG: ATP synthase F1 subunit gamma [Patescibacteria group bacterium]|nr:ATP synthase F1 subunit gamma [Patescibacteria group bacterium]